MPCLTSTVAPWSSKTFAAPTWLNLAAMCKGASHTCVFVDACVCHCVSQPFALPLLLTEFFRFTLCPVAHRYSNTFSSPLRACNHMLWFIVCTTLMGFLMLLCQLNELVQA